MLLHSGTAMEGLRLSPTSSHTRNTRKSRSFRCCSRGASGRSPRYARSWRTPPASHRCSAACGRVSCCGWREDFRQRNFRTTSARAFASVMCRKTSTGLGSGAVPYRKARRIRSSLEWSDGIDTAYRPDAVLSILDRLVARPPLPPGCLQGPQKSATERPRGDDGHGPDSFTAIWCR